MKIHSVRWARFVSVSASVFVLSQSVAAAQTPAVSQVDHAHLSLGAPEGPALSLNAAIDEALARNPDLAFIRSQVEPLRTRPGQERGLAPPMLEAQIWQWPINTLNPANANMYALMVTQELPGRGKRALRAAVAQKDVDIATNEIAIRERQVVDGVKQAYADLFVARKAADIHLAHVDIVRQIEQASQAKYAAGRISQQDVLKAVVELSSLHEHLVMFDEQASMATVRLNTLLDRPAAAPIGPLTELVERPLSATVDQLMSTAVERHPELSAARLSVERAEAELGVAAADYKPDFSVQGGYALMPGQTDALMARVGVTWPSAPWSRGRLDMRKAEMAAAVSAAKARVRAIESGVRLAVQEAYIRASAAWQRMVLFRTTIVPQARQTLDVSRIAYQTDRADFRTMLENERTVLEAELNYYKALVDFEQASADLERASGTEFQR